MISGRLRNSHESTSQKDLGDLLIIMMKWNNLLRQTSILPFRATRLELTLINSS